MAGGGHVSVRVTASCFFPIMHEHKTSRLCVTENCLTVGKNGRHGVIIPDLSSHFCRFHFGAGNKCKPLRGEITKDRMTAGGRTLMDGLSPRLSARVWLQL
eukprot:jgi/Bigna1/60207/fgenesh1_kg.10_\